MSSAFNIPAGWREVLIRAKEGLGAGGRNHGDQAFIDYGAALIDHIEEGIDALAAPTPPVDAVPGEPVAFVCVRAGEADARLPCTKHCGDRSCLAASVASRAGMEPVAWEVLTLGEWRPTRFPDELRAKGFEVRAAPSTLRQPEAAGQAKPRDRQPMGKQAKELERLARAWVYAAIRSVEQKAPNYVSDHEEACELAFRAAIVAIEPIVRERAASLVGSEGMVLVPRELLQAASESLGSFVSDHGWSQHDMDVMDSIDAVLAARASAGEAQS